MVTPLGSSAIGHDIIVTKDRFLVGREFQGALPDYAFSKDELSVSCRQFTISRQEQGYFIECCSQQFPTKLVLNRTPYLLHDGLILEIGSVFNPAIRLEVVMDSSDDFKAKAIHDFYRLTGPDEYSSKLSYYSEKNLIINFSNKHGSEAKRSISLTTEDRSKLQMLNNHTIACFDDSKVYYPQMYLRVLKGKEYFQPEIAKHGLIIIGSLEKATIGTMKEFTIPISNLRLPLKALVVSYDFQRGWLAHYSDSDDYSTGTFILLKNRAQLRQGRPSNPYKLYQGMRLAVGYHLFEVSSKKKMQKSKSKEITETRRIQ